MILGARLSDRAAAVVATIMLFAGCAIEPVAADHLRDLQTEAIRQGKSRVGHWGHDPQNYTGWDKHTNRLIPVYTFGTRDAGPGIDLRSYTGQNSPYRDKASLRRIYGRVPSNTLNPTAGYCDQTNVADIQRAAIRAGKKFIFLVIFDGMDWQTTRAAAIYKSGKVTDASGRGSGLHFLNYNADGTTQFGYFVSTPHNTGTIRDVDRQSLKNPGGTQPGGYHALKAGPTPWTPGNDRFYPIGKQEGSSQPESGEHAYADSASTATAMTTGIKTYNGSINVSRTGEQLTTIAHLAQERKYSIGAVTSVPISHATPAAAYAHNVERNDYQDLSRDLLGLPSVAHPRQALAGLDVLIGGGFGVPIPKDAKQGTNIVPGNLFLTDADRRKIDVRYGGQYTVAIRTAGVSGKRGLHNAVRNAIRNRTRLFGFYGVGKYRGHLPYRTADGDYQPAPGRLGTAEAYSKADVDENPTLAEMTAAAIDVLSRNKNGFWLMVEAGDVDWANHDNNLDSSIGAVYSGEDAVRVITGWVELHSSWKESLLIVTADHGHYLVLKRPELLVPAVR